MDLLNILSFQSEVVFGHVGHGAARFALQRLGHEVWAIPTVLLSSHAGYARVEGEITAAGSIRRLLDAMAANGWLAGCNAAISGYLGHPDQAAPIAESVRRMREDSGAIYCLDPVFGDDGRAYARPGVAEAMARTLLPLADVVTPNTFELASLAGMSVRSVEEALLAAKRLARPLVAATSVPCGDGRIGVLSVCSKGAWLASTPQLADAPHGAGDLFAALFLNAQLRRRKPDEAVAYATGHVFGILERSVGSGEMRLIEEQDRLGNARPSVDVRVERIE